MNSMGYYGANFTVCSICALEQQPLIGTEVNHGKAEN